MSLTNLVTGDFLEPQYNPETLEEEVGAAWAALQVPGLSHPRKHYSNTEDAPYQFTLLFSSVNGGVDRQNQIETARKFLLASVCPRAGAGAVKTAGPPRILFVWPTLLSLTCVITKVKFTHEQFNYLGSSVRYRAAVSIAEIRDTLMTMEDVLRFGTLRPGRGQETF
jgi:hypothetical protein